MSRPLPTRIVVPGLVDIEVRRERLPEKTLADFDRETHVLRVCDSLDGVDAHVALVHELLHATETIVPRADGQRACRIPHHVLNRIDAVVLSLLVEAGLYKGVSKRELAAWRRRKLH